MWYLPKMVKCMKDIPYRHCLCCYCLNYSLLIDAMRAVGYAELIRKLTAVLLLSMCCPGGESITIGDCRHDCIFCDCSLCGEQLLHE